MRVYSAPNMAMVAHIKNVLEAHDIPTAVRGEFRGAMAGEVPPIECWPELWLMDESQAEEAKTIIRDVIQPQESDLPAWKCPNCEEDIDGQFSNCWNCGTDRPGN